MKKYYYINGVGGIQSAEAGGWELSVRLRKMMGNYFETELEAEAYIDYLLVREVIKEDTKGFEPNWQNAYEQKYYGEWNFNDRTPHIGLSTNFKKPQIYFKTVEDIQESFKKHSKEWKRYLTYKQ